MENLLKLKKCATVQDYYDSLLTDFLLGEENQVRDMFHAMPQESKLDFFVLYADDKSQSRLFSFLLKTFIDKS